MFIVQALTELYVFYVFLSTGEEEDEGYDSIELVPNIILNPGFCEMNENESPYIRTLIFSEDEESYEEEEENEAPMEAFKRKVSIFFTGHTIRRI